MINVGLIGIGFMGVTHFKAFAALEGARVAAISTRNAQKLSGDWRSIKGNFGEGGGQQDLAGIACYAQWQEMLSDESIDLIDVCLPTHLHRDVVIAALQAGKHVLVEKPISLSLADADAMIAAANQADRMLMVGHVLRFFPAFAEAHAIVQGGAFGSLLGAHLKRIIAAPTWATDDHFAEVSKSGGPAIDVHIHDTDFVHYLAGVPQWVRSVGVTSSQGAVTYLQTQYGYEDGQPCITSQSGALSMPGLQFEHGFDIYLERATLQFNNLFTGEDIWLYTADGEKQSVKPQREDAFIAQLRHVVECLSSGTPSNLIAATMARQALAVCLQEQQSVLSGETIAITA